MPTSKLHPHLATTHPQGKSKLFLAGIISSNPSKTRNNPSERYKCKTRKKDVSGVAQSA